MSADLTLEQLLALPEINSMGACDVVTDADGHSRSVRKPAQFLVNDSDVLFYTLPDGSRWRVCRDSQGTHYRERVGIY